MYKAILADKELNSSDLVSDLPYSCYKKTCQSGKEKAPIVVIDGSSCPIIAFPKLANHHSKSPCGCSAIPGNSSTEWDHPFGHQMYSGLV